MVKIKLVVSTSFSNKVWVKPSKMPCITLREGMEFWVRVAILNLNCKVTDWYWSHDNQILSIMLNCGYTDPNVLESFQEDPSWEEFG